MLLHFGEINFPQSTTIHEVIINVILENTVDTKNGNVIILLGKLFILQYKVMSVTPDITSFYRRLTEDIIIQ